MSRAGAADDARAGAATAAAASAGFTLVELLVVVVIMGMLAAVALPRFASLRQPGLPEVGRQVVADLRARRTEAMRTGRIVVAGAGELGGRLPRGFALLPAGGGASDGGIVFLPDGRSGGGRLELSRGEDRMPIVVDWLTGQVRADP